MKSKPIFLKYHKIAAICMGVWNVEVENRFLKMLRNLIRYLPQIHYVYYVVAMCIGSIDILDDDDRRSEMLQFILIFAFIIFKIILGQTKSIQRLMELILNEEVELMQEDENITRLYLDGCKYNFKIFYVLSSLIVLGVLQVLGEGYVNFKAYDAALAKGLTPTTEMLFAQWIPPRWRKYYKRVYVYQAGTALISGGYIVAFDSLFASLINFPSVRLNILGYKFNNMEKYFKSDQAENKKIMKSFIMEHQTIIKYVDDLNDAMRWYFFADFLVRSYHITLVLLEMFNGKEKPIIDVCFEFIKLLYIFIQIWYIYYNANALMLVSSGLNDQIFQSKWYELSLDLKRDLCQVMVRARKPLVIWIGNFSTIDNELLFKILKASYIAVVLSYL